MKIFIPIKHNSQRVPRKNFRRFGKEPLFKHALLKFKKHEVYVDTDSQDVIDMILSDKRLKHVHVFYRKETLRGDKVSVCDLIKDFIDRFDINEPIAQIHVTSPFLTSQILEDAYSKIKNYDSVVSCNVHNSRFWRNEQYGMCPVNHNPVKMEQTQDLPTLYEENSCFYIFEPYAIMNLGSRIGRNPYFYPINKTESIDIDTEDDWEFASKLKDILK
jgi:CMP-N-acetylneuraminic acid synthetase